MGFPAIADGWTPQDGPEGVGYQQKRQAHTSGVVACRFEATCLLSAVLSPFVFLTASVPQGFAVQVTSATATDSTSDDSVCVVLVLISDGAITDEYCHLCPSGCDELFYSAVPLGHFAITPPP